MTFASHAWAFSLRLLALLSVRVSPSSNQLLLFFFFNLFKSEYVLAQVDHDKIKKKNQATLSSSRLRWWCIIDESASGGLAWSWVTTTTLPSGGSEFTQTLNAAAFFYIFYFGSRSLPFAHITTGSERAGSGLERKEARQGYWQSLCKNKKQIVFFPFL